MSTRSGPTLLHNGYTGSVEVSMNDNCLHGRIQNIDDVIAYEGQSPVELQREFVAAVDEYLKHCRVIGKAPDRHTEDRSMSALGPNVIDGSFSTQPRPASM